MFLLSLGFCYPSILCSCEVPCRVSETHRFRQRPPPQKDNNTIEDFKRTVLVGPREVKITLWSPRFGTSIHTHTHTHSLSHSLSLTHSLPIYIYIYMYANTYMYTYRCILFICAFIYYINASISNGASNTIHDCLNGNCVPKPLSWYRRTTSKGTRMAS